MATIKVKQGDEWVKIPNIGIVEGVPEAPIDGEQYARQDATWTKVKSSEPFVNAEYGKIIKEANESQSITQDNYNLLLNAITSSSNGALFCEYEHLYGRLYFTALPTDSGDILVYVNVQMAHVPEPSFMSGVMTISSDLTVTNNTSSSITLRTSGDGTKYLADDGEYKDIHSYTTATTVASLNVDYENILVTLTANASLSASATGADYNGRTITAYVYTAAAQTITIPTTGDYVSMCGSSFATTAGGWVEFNLTCIDGKWHIAKLEQE